MITNPTDNSPPHESLETVSNLPTDDEYNARLDAEYAAEAKRLRQSKRRKGIFSVIVLGALIGGGFYWYKTNPENQQKLQSVIDEAAAVKDAITKDAQSMGSMEAYEEALEEISKHGETVDSASAALSGNDKLEPQAPADRTADQTTEESDGTDNPESPGNQAPERRGF